jgi:nucleoside-diphosphate-sugar epimerase
MCFGSSARELRLRGGFSVPQHPLSAIDALDRTPSLVLHNAFLTQEKAKLMPREEYVAVNESISRAVLESLDRIGARGLFLPSSGAVYMLDNPGSQDSMRLYGEMKLADEARFGAWSDDSGHPVAIARVFNLSGPYINKRSSYALACFIADALAGRPISIRADHPVFRSYVAVSELMSVVFGALTDPPYRPIVFDTAGDDVYEMAKIAQVVGNVLHHDRGIDRPALQDGDIDSYVGDGTTYASLRRLNRVTPVGFADQVRETARYMAECGDDLN